MKVRGKIRRVGKYSYAAIFQKKGLDKKEKETLEENLGEEIDISLSVVKN